MLRACGIAKNLRQLRTDGQSKSSPNSTNLFPYAPGKYIFDDKDNLGFAEAFRNAATIANPLAERAGTQRQIGRHIDMKVNANQTFIIIHKGCPPRSIKILAAQIQGHSISIIVGHAELFE